MVWNCIQNVQTYYRQERYIPLWNGSSSWASKIRILTNRFITWILFQYDKFFLITVVLKFCKIRLDKNSIIKFFLWKNIKNCVLWWCHHTFTNIFPNTSLLTVLIEAWIESLLEKNAHLSINKVFRYKHIAFRIQQQAFHWKIDTSWWM